MLPPVPSAVSTSFCDIAVELMLTPSTEAGTAQTEVLSPTAVSSLPAVSAVDKTAVPSSGVRRASVSSISVSATMAFNSAKVLISAGCNAVSAVAPCVAVAKSAVSMF